MERRETARSGATRREPRRKQRETAYCETTRHDNKQHETTPKQHRNDNNAQTQTQTQTTTNNGNEHKRRGRVCDSFRARRANTQARNSSDVGVCNPSVPETFLSVTKSQMEGCKRRTIALMSLFTPTYSRHFSNCDTKLSGTLEIRRC